jgi:hypothetical protein
MVRQRRGTGGEEWPHSGRESGGGPTATACDGGAAPGHGRIGWAVLAVGAKNRGRWEADR